MKIGKVICSSAMLAVICVLVTGCGKPGGAPLGQVSGTVQHNGKPIEEAKIVFHHPQGRSATGQIVDGTIKNVTTNAVLNDGAPVGTLVVTIHSLDAKKRLTSGPGKNAKTSSKPPFPARYSDQTLSGLKADIKPGTNNLSFDLTD